MRWNVKYRNPREGGNHIMREIEALSIELCDDGSLLFIGDERSIVEAFASGQWLRVSKVR